MARAGLPVRRAGETGRAWIALWAEGRMLVPAHLYNVHVPGQPGQPVPVQHLPGHLDLLRKLFVSSELFVDSSGSGPTWTMSTTWAHARHHTFLARSLTQNGNDARTVPRPHPGQQPYRGGGHTEPRANLVHVLKRIRTPDHHLTAVMKSYTDVVLWMLWILCDNCIGALRHYPGHHHLHGHLDLDGVPVRS
jgi:hypothetical protein